MSNIVPTRLHWIKDDGNDNPSAWRQSVVKFCDAVEAFYDRSLPKTPSDAVERDGFQKMNGGGVENWLIENIGTLPNDLSTNRAKSIYRDLRKRQNGQSAKPSCWRIACAVIAEGAILTLGKRSDFSMPRQAAVCPQR